MLVSESVKRYAEIINYVENHYFYKCLIDFNQYYDQVKEVGLEYCRLQNNQQNTSKTQIGQINQTLRNKIDVYRFSVSVNQFQQYVDTVFLNENILSGGEVNYLKSSIEPLTHRLNEYTRTYNFNSLVSFLNQAHFVFSQINLILQNLTFSIEKFSINVEIPENYERLVLIFEREFSLEEISAKLSAINLIYEEFCLILDINSKEFPIKVIKIETGSLEIKIDGIKDIIDLIKYLIDKFFDWANKNSHDGKIKSILEDIRAFEQYLDITSKAQQQGHKLNTKKINQLHDKIGERLENLLEPSLKVNEKQYIFANEKTQIQTAYLEESENLLLEEGKEEEKDNDSIN
ncbi:hypothetical protein GM3708_468 [Geminocystis sp. NIES-3708]|uniref:hypothetical protein n=1 Tax=Geminocystis sp. NIES-3708 TaxID=1615909 RepID=UPI0005FC5FBF|nr:hypothetical protein [Geminocystis sp. NIES-3708]BAQ60062.1 hypothetical protein GM3708_468 [Geminocystis sp. NIES-3708]